MDARDVPLVLLAAPAGYGKSALLAEWAAREERPFARLERPANGPRGLVAGIAEALYDAGLVASSGARLSYPGADTVAGRLALLLEEASAEGPFVVVVDDASLDADAAAIVADVAAFLPGGTTLALAARTPLPLPIGRLRALGLAVELGPRALAMTRIEAAQLLDAAGCRLGAAEVDRLVEATEGWPVAISLAAVDAVEPFPDVRGGDRLIADYIRSEVLGSLADERVAFLRRTSVLERLGGPLCDAVLETRGSARVIHALAAANLPLGAGSDSSGLRVHPLVAEMLRDELRREEPELESVVRRRAADWYAARGHAEQALRQTVACRDRARAGRILWSITPVSAVRGDVAGLHRWLDCFGDRDLEADAGLAATAAACELTDGRRDAADRWIDSAALRGGPQACVSLLRACVARRGVAAMGEEAREACVLMPHATIAVSLGRLIEGVAHHLMGDRDEAGLLLEEAARLAGAQAPLVSAHAHAQRALLAVEQRDWPLAAAEVEVARDALATVDPGSPLRGLVLAVAAAVAAQQGDVAATARDAAAARRCLAGLADFTPWYVAEAQIWLARAMMLLSDAATARMLLARAARSPATAEAPVLASWLHDAWERADAFAAGVIGDGPALTTAELRVLRFLPSHLSFREIGALLHVSTNTVKTQALAVYRKLDVSSRSEAVARGRSIGLLDG